MSSYRSEGSLIALICRQKVGTKCNGTLEPSRARASDNFLLFYRGKKVAAETLAFDVLSPFMLLLHDINVM